MATRYGFRLYTVYLRNEHKQQNLDFGTATLGVDGQQESFKEVINSVCGRLKGVTNTEALVYRRRDENDEADAHTENADSQRSREDTSPHIRLDDFTFRTGRIDFRFWYGRRGSHEKALAERVEDDADLSTKAPSNTYRAYLFLPQGDSPQQRSRKAILASEVRGRSAPGKEVLKLLGVTLLHDDESAPAGEEPGWWRFVVHQIVDMDHWDRVIKGGQARGLVFTTKTPTGSGAVKPDTIELRQNGFPVKKTHMAAEMLNTWKQDKGRNDQDKHEETLNPVDALKPFMTQDVDLSAFDDAGIIWESAAGGVNTYKPGDFTDVYTYPVGEPGTRPSERQLLDEIRSKLQILQPVEEIQLDLT